MRLNAIHGTSPVAKETITVPAFEVTLERTDDNDLVCLDDVEYSVSAMKDCLKGRQPFFERAMFVAVIAHLDANKPDPKPGFTVRHEVDGEWKWTAIFTPAPEDVSNTKWPWNVTDNCGNAAWHTRDEFATLCERDGVTL